MSRKAWLVSAVVVLVLATVAVLSQRLFRSSGAMKIGATLPLTGDAAVWGKNTQKGIEMALEEVNAAGGVRGREVAVVYEDTKAMPKEGVNAYQKVTAVDGVTAIIDDSVSSVTLAMAPLAERDHVVVLSVGATAPKLSDAGDYIFRIWNSDAYEGEVTATYVFDRLSLRKVAILYINNDYGKGLEEVFTSRFTEHGGKVVVTESFAQNATDMRAQLTKVRAASPDALYLVGYPKEIPIALRQARELGLRVALVGTVAMHDPQLIKAAGDAAEGLVFPYPKEPAGGHVERFRQAFKRRYGEDPGITADVGYDALKMLAAAIEASGDFSGEGIRAGLNTLKDYPGVSGTMTFDEKGDVHKPLGMKVVLAGQFVWKE